jgi:hypothetical protein
VIEVSIAVPALATASAAARAGLPADLAFCHPAIRSVVRIDAEAVTVTVAEDSDELRRLIEEVVRLSLRSYRFVQPQPPLWEHGNIAAYKGGAEGLATFIAQHTIELGPGQYALVGPAAKLRAVIERRLAALAESVGAEPWHLPSIEQTSDLIPHTGYLAASGQYVTFGYRLPCHFERLRQFATEARERRLERPNDPRELEPTGFILEPFVCHNVYRALRGTRLPNGVAGRTITALGTCYRHESFRFQPLLRQWEFSMREVVLVGTPDYVKTQRDRLLEATQQLVRDLDLAAHLEIATDPFFVSEAGSARTFQALHSTKLELVLALGDATQTAASSFNLHGTHFTEPMQITSAGGTLLETACVGWGLERWMGAIVARWGVDPPFVSSGSWPSPRSNW